MIRKSGTVAVVSLLLLLGITPAPADPPCEDSVHAVVAGSAVTIYHDGATYNCCPDPFAYTVTCGGATIVVQETEVLTEPCFCICCFDLSVTVEDVAPGDYTVVFTWFDYETNEWCEWPLEVTVPDVGQGGAPAVVATTNSGCYDPATGTPEDGPERENWGGVKGRYR